MEVFKDIPNYEGLYQVSNLGNVKSLRKGLILKGYKDSRGYVNIKLQEKGIKKYYRIHQLLAITFLNHNPNGYSIVVDHIDNNKENNNLNNLQVISQRENLSKDKKGLSKYVGVNWNNSAKKWVARISINGKRKFLGYFSEQKEASEAYNIELSLINKSN